MSVCEMIELANRIVNGEPVKTPAIEAWIISEIIWWAHNRDNALVWVIYGESVMLSLSYCVARCIT